MKTSENRGSIFVMVTLIVSILLIALGMLLTVATTDLRISKSYGDGIKAYSLAQSGVEEAMAYVLVPGNRGRSYDAPLEQSPFAGTYSSLHSVDWNVVYNNPGYTITSTGEYNGSIRRLRVLITLDVNDRITVKEWRQE